MSLCVTYVCYFLQTGDVAYFSSGTIQRRLRSKLHKATWIGLNGGLVISSSAYLRRAVAAWTSFLKTGRLLLLEMELWQKKNQMYLWQYLCLSISAALKKGKGFSVWCFSGFSENVFLCKFHCALKDKVILRLLSPFESILGPVQSN